MNFKDVYSFREVVTVDVAMDAGVVTVVAVTATDGRAADFAAKLFLGCLSLLQYVVLSIGPVALLRCPEEGSSMWLGLSKQVASSLVSPSVSLARGLLVTRTCNETFLQTVVTRSTLDLLSPRFILFVVKHLEIVASKLRVLLTISVNLA